MDVEAILAAVKEQLGQAGIQFETCCGEGAGAAAGESASGRGEANPEGDQPRVKVVCVAPTLKDSAAEMSCCTRDQVVMVRVDHETATKLDAWVETDAVRSRSEAAALFIREGLKVRASELDRLHDALAGVQDAKKRLRREARAAFGMGAGDETAE